MAPVQASPYRGQVRISELADKVGVPVSTVRYYERIGLLPDPARTGSGYREYDADSATQLLFVTRARKLGLTCEQVIELLPIWGGSNCTSTPAAGRTMPSARKPAANTSSLSPLVSSTYLRPSAERGRTPA
mgnify:CR=1 FL=1